MLYVLITGTRYGTERQWKDIIINATRKHVGGERYVLVHGDARGIDRVAEKVLSQSIHPYSISRFPANWDAYGYSAGPRRNKEMIDFITSSLTHHSDHAVCLAFHDDLANSKGTGNMVKQARSAGIPVFTYGGE